MRAIQIAKILRVDRKTVILWIKKGLLKGKMVKPKIGFGGHDYWTCSKQEINKYLNKWQ